MKNESNLLDMRAMLGETEVIDGNDYVSQNYMLNQQSFENESFLLDISHHHDPNNVKMEGEKYEMESFGELKSRNDEELLLRQFGQRILPGES